MEVLVCLLIGYVVYGILLVAHKFLTRDIVRSPFYVLHPALLTVVSAVFVQPVMRTFIMARYRRANVLDLASPIAGVAVPVTLIAWLFHVILF